MATLPYLDLSSLLIFDPSRVTLTIDPFRPTTKPTLGALTLRESRVFRPAAKA
jgi:hypothetical protein